ncbi:MAG: NAD(P)/FAD-dependent oxidoreductase [Deltaproteobacteria bacterium]|nr:NAD(P)/FAD-dependent oxidoreductase [Deltaproteobacteria bacterium]
MDASNVRSPARVPRVVVVGGGFGGLRVAQGLARVSVRVTLLDRRNFHLFQPLLYQVATGGLSPANIAAPLRGVLRRQRNAEVLLAEAVGLDASRRVLELSDGFLTYDALVVATGSTHHYFGHERWEALAPGLKTLEDATEIRRRLLLAFEAAEREPDAARAAGHLTFAVVGAGPTGVELAGALAEIARDTLRGNFRHFDPANAQIVLMDAVSRPLPNYPEKLSRSAERSLRELGVSVLTGATVKAVEPNAIAFEKGGRLERLPAANVFWAAGVKASPLGQVIARATGAELDRQGRVVVSSDLSVPGFADLFVIGDLAHAEQDGHPLPGVAPVAMQQGRYVARRIRDRLAGRKTPPFRYRDRGSMAVIGRTRAVAQMGPLKFGGYFAWLAWLFIHLMYLVGFGLRLLALMQWAWNYLTFGRSARLITGSNPLPLLPTLPAQPAPPPSASPEDRRSAPVAKTNDEAQPSRRP